MDDQLTFGSSYSIEQFKSEMECSAIDIIKSPKTGKLFFIADNGMQGPVSNKADLDSDTLVITKCETPEGEQMWMLHKKATDNVVKTL